jgi:hypothetical protein
MTCCIARRWVETTCSSADKVASISTGSSSLRCSSSAKCMSAANASAYRSCASNRSGPRPASTEPATNAPTAFGQDLRQLLDDAAGFTGAAALLGPQDVDPAVDQAAGVGLVRLLLLGLVAQRAQLGQRQTPHVGQVVLGEHPVDAPCFPGLDLHAELPPLAPPACAGTTVHHTGYRP